jgi:GNAT superfamily N-acetyltransferase
MAFEQVEVVTHYLEMKQPPPGALPPPPRDGVRVVRAEKPSARFYRYLYEGVGEPWHWLDRGTGNLSDDACEAIVQHPDVAIDVLWVGGVPAGYAELDWRASAQAAGDIELAYFGLLPEFIGQRLGPWFLAAAVDAAWQRRPERLYVHTCSLDHPAALGYYQKAGFVKYKETRHRQVIMAMPS